MKKYLFLFAFLCSASFMYAQIKSELQLGILIPNGDFGDDDTKDVAPLFNVGKSGGAAMGFSLNYKLLSPLGGIKNLYSTFSVGIHYNDLNGDVQDDFDEMLVEYADYDYSLPKYLNIPVMVGLQYENPLSATASLYGEAGLGINMLKVTALSVEKKYYNYSYTSIEEEQTFDLSTGFGYKLGFGFVFNDKYTVGLSYLNLGTHKLKHKVKTETIYNDKDKPTEFKTEKGKFKRHLPVSMISLTVGIRF